MDEEQILKKMPPRGKILIVIVTNNYELCEYFIKHHFCMFALVSWNLDATPEDILVHSVQSNDIVFPSTFLTERNQWTIDQDCISLPTAIYESMSDNNDDIIFRNRLKSAKTF